MGQQISTGRLHRLSNGGQMPRASRGSRTQTLQQQEAERSQSLLIKPNPDSIRLALSRGDTGPIQAPLAPLGRRLPPSFEQEASTGILDDPVVALQTIPTAEAIASVHSSALPLASLVEGEEEGEPGLKLLDLPEDLVFKCLAKLPRSTWPAARAVCATWRHAVGGPESMWQRKEMGHKDSWAYVVEWVFGNPKEKRGILWAWDQSAEHLYRVGWVPVMEGINHTSHMVAVEDQVLFLGGTISVDKDDGTMDIVPGPQMWSYNMQTGAPQQLPSMLNGRVHFAHGILDGKLVIAGGTGPGDAMMTEVEAFDPVTVTWHSMPPLTVPRGKCFGGVKDGKFYVFSQNADEAPEKYAEVYDPATQKWKLDRKMLPMNFLGKVPSRLAVQHNKVVTSSDLGADCGNGSMERTRANLSLGNQLTWCTSVL